MSSKDEILGKIKEAIKDLDYVKKDVEKASIHIKNDGDLVQNCIDNLQANKTEVITCKEEELEENIIKLLKDLGTKNLLHSSNLPFDISKFDTNLIAYKEDVNQIHNTLFQCDTSIIKAKLAISNLGVFCVTSDEQPRLMSLLPQNCIILLKKEDIVDSMNSAYEVIQKDKTPTNIIFISGPSRTADIELIVVLGVHGPQRVYGLIY